MDRKTTYLITGASSGIGFELSKRLASEGGKVIAVGRNSTRLSKLAALSENISPVEFDISQIDKISGFAQRMISEHPSIAVLVNNAGVSDSVRFDDPAYGAARIETEIRINLTAPVCLAHAFLKHLEAQRDARIVNVSSGLALIPKKTSAVYSATKAGLHLFSEGLRVQTESDLLIQEVILPVVDTPMTEGRGSGKISASEAASQIITGIRKGKDKIYVGKARLLPFLIRWFPSVARSAIQKDD
ncbi:MAG: SDR family NAD(P)-dependent oxidoreductase [Henriciella sp.]|nr:SDR family NAD(P)-dependent oxidoreductase [Henriciella sp.]MBO6696633.1 SDR family NAD(P)-dependent oxidoreductase [Henriciella sp.]